MKNGFSVGDKVFWETSVSPLVSSKGSGVISSISHSIRYSDEIVLRIIVDRTGDYFDIASLSPFFENLRLA